MWSMTFDCKSNCCFFIAQDFIEGLINPSNCCFETIGLDISNFIVKFSFSNCCFIFIIVFIRVQLFCLLGNCFILIESVSSGIGLRISHLFFEAHKLFIFMNFISF